MYWIYKVYPNQNLETYNFNLSLESDQNLRISLVLMWSLLFSTYSKVYVPEQ